MRAHGSSRYPHRSGFFFGEAEAYSLILSCQLACWRFWMTGFLALPNPSELMASRIH